MPEGRPGPVVMYGVAVAGGLTVAAVVALTARVGLGTVLAAGAGAFAVVAAVLAARAAHRVAQGVKGREEHLAQQVADLQKRLAETEREVSLLLEMAPYDQIEAVARHYGFEPSVDKREFHLHHPGGVRIDHISPNMDPPREVMARLKLRALAREVGSSKSTVQRARRDQAQA